MVCLSRPYHLKIFKGCLPQISLGPFLNTFPQTNLIQAQIIKIILDKKNKNDLGVNDLI